MSHTHPLGNDEKRNTEFDYLEKAVSNLLIERRLISDPEIWAQIDDMESRSSEAGARLVSLAWTDHEFRNRLLSNPIETIKGEGIKYDASHDLRILPASDDVHYVIVCTLCSCYPRALLGLPPSWYKSKAYRSRVVREPREVLAEFGTHLSSNTQVRVVDSTADMRYFVLPMRPIGTEEYDLNKLARLVSRDVLIGMRLPQEGVFHG